jgi:hypothetical protein
MTVNVVDGDDLGEKGADRRHLGRFAFGFVDRSVQAAYHSVAS